jgi:hypothetical protein
MATVWRVLVAASKGWQEVRQCPSWWWALLTHWVLQVLTGLLVYKPMLQLASQTGLGVPADYSLAPPLAILAIALSVVVSMLIAAAGGGVVLLTLGIRRSFAGLMSWVSYGLLPLSLGQCAGGLLFAIVQPLTQDSEQALALSLRPYSFGAAGLMPDLLPPLSFGWFVASYFDLFGLWALVLLLVGARELFGTQRVHLLWLGLELVLVFSVIITGLWLASQQLLVGLAG